MSILEKIVSLSSYNVNQQLVNHFNHFLTQTISFSTLKSLVLAKKPHKEIHQALLSEIENRTVAEQLAIQKTLEQKALTQQRNEDERAESTEQQLAIQRQVRRPQLLLALAAHNTRISELQLELHAITQKMTPSSSHQHEHPSNSSSHVHTHESSSSASNPSQHHTHPSTSTLSEQAQHIGRQLKAIRFAVSQINTELRMLDVADEQAINVRTQQMKRRHARTKLDEGQDGVTIGDALSPSKYKELQEHIRKAHQDIERHSKELINEAFTSNYSIFLQQLELSLVHLACSTEEQEALKDVLKFMKVHLEHVTKTQKIQNDLDRSITTLHTETIHLTQLRAREGELTNAHPHLTKKNEALRAENETLTQKQKANYASRDEILTSTLMFAGLALLCSIPLILALGGVLAPMAAAPAILLVLTSITPALSLIASLGLGITALVYGIIGAVQGSQIGTNNKTINRNLATMEENKEEFAKLQTATIPECVNTVAECKKHIDLLNIDLAKEQSLAQEALDQAALCEPRIKAAPSSPTLKPTETAPTFFKPILQSPALPAKLVEEHTYPDFLTI